MSIVDVIKNLTFHISPKWSKSIGDNSNTVKQKINTNTGNNAGRDINITGVSNEKESPPYVYVCGTSIGGNGLNMLISANIENLGSGPVIIEQIEVLGHKVLFNRPIKANEKVRTGNIDNLTYPISDKPHDFVVTFHDLKNRRYESRHALIFANRADGKFNISLSTSPEINEITDESNNG